MPKPIFAMSDEEFSKMEVPSTEPEAPASPESVEQVVEAEDVPAVADTPETVVETAPSVEEQPQQVEEVNQGSDAEADTDPASVATPPDAVDYQKNYEQILAPFKANGKMMQVTSPDEAIALMQQGANYTHKMQEMQSQRKLLLMLENNGLLDTGKLSYLIDLDKKNPEAIKKLIKDSNLDVLELDPSAEASYSGGNYAVTDAEANFRSVLDELSASPVGKETLSVINSSWDAASKEIVWQEPGIMTMISAQRENGMYAQISDEVERRRILGQIPANVSFLHAYKYVGDDLQSKGILKNPEPTAKAPSAPVAKKVALPKPTNNATRAQAAATTRSAPSPAKSAPNYLAMSDAEFLKLGTPN